MKKILQTITLLCLPFFAFSQSVEKTLVKSFNLQDRQLVTLRIAEPVSWQTWDRPLLRIQMTVRIENGSEATLKSLVRAGRYNLESEMGPEAMTVLAPDLDRKITIGQQVLKEDIRVQVFVPKHVQLQLFDDGSSVSLPDTEPTVFR